MTIQLTDWKISNLNFSLLPVDSYRAENNFNLQTGNHFHSNSNDDEFIISFNVKIEDQIFDLVLEAMFTFQVNEKITEEFKLSDFPKVNAPAIAFPYIRAYISNLTLQSGIDPVILPSINFVKLAEDKNTN